MQAEVPLGLVPGRPLQSLCLGRVVDVLPRLIDTGLFALPTRAHAHSCLLYALRLFASPALPSPAIPLHKIFIALRRSDLPEFDLLGAHEAHAVPSAPITSGDTAFLDHAVLPGLPALPTLQAFPALPASIVSALESLGPDQVADILAAYLTAQSQQCAFEKIALSTAHIASARALELFLTAVARAGHSKELTSLTLRGVGMSATYVTQADVLHMASHVRGLSVLRLPGLRSVDDTNIVALLKAAGPELVELDLSMTGITGSGLNAALSLADISSTSESFRDALEYLDLTSTSVDAESLLCLVGMAALQELRIGWTPIVRPSISEHRMAVDDTALSQILGSVIGFVSLPSLRRLDVSGATIDLSHALSAASALEHIVLVGAEVDYFGDFVISKLPGSLSVLDISQMTGRSLDVAALFAREVKDPMSSLRVLNLSSSQLSGWREYEDGKDIDWENNLLTSAFRNLFFLRELDISDTQCLSSNAVVAMLSGCCWYLETIKMRHTRHASLLGSIRNRTTEIGSVLAFPDLRELDFGGSFFGDEITGILPIFLTYASQIEVISLGGTNKLGDDALRLIVILVTRSIRRLDISRTVVSSAGLDSWQRQMPCLKVVDLRHCPRVSKESIFRFCGRAPKLEIVQSSFDHSQLPLAREVVRARRAAHLPLGRKAVRARRAYQLPLGREVVRARRASQLVEDAKKDIPEWRRRSRMNY